MEANNPHLPVPGFRSEILSDNEYTDPSIRLDDARRHRIFLTSIVRVANMTSIMRLPAVNTFRFFEAAARHRNFTRAAEELHVTHGAVSQQIKSLEEATGKRLFLRKGGEMQLTQEGAELLSYVTEAFSKLTEGMQAARGATTSRRLTINAHPAFTARWLVPRLHDFCDHCPDLEIHVRSSLSLVSFRTNRVDIAIRFGGGDWPELTTHKLMDEELFPVANPNYNSGNLPHTRAELAQAKLLHDERFPWNLWFRSLDANAYPARRNGLMYSDASLLLQSAAGGHGVALGRGRLCAEELASGRLVRLSDEKLAISDAYYVVYPRQHACRAPVREFMTWLREQVNACN
jgi:LysR family glycine cleavage system transcriptional activator